MKYRYLSIIKKNQEYNLVPYDNRQIHDKAVLRNLITIYQGPLNNVGDKRNALSTSWFNDSKNKHLIVTLSRNARNFLLYTCKANKDTTLWTTVKGKNDKIKDKVKPQSYSDTFLPMTTRATNDYSERYHLAYLINRFMNPIEKKFFEQYGVKIDQDAWAISELIQWVWRSRIRDGKKIEIYIPSSRMHKLFEKYLTSDYFEEFSEGAIINQPPTDWNL